MNLGKWEIDDFLTFVANTHHPETGQATDADSVPTYRIYEDETGTPILTGSMALLDSANTAGFYSERIQLTAANGFEVGKSYSIYVSATVGTIVGTMSHFFQMGVEGATAAALQTVDDNVDAILVDTGTTLPAEHALLATAASIAGLNDLSSADIQTVIETNDLDHLAKVAHPSGDPVANTLLDYMMNVDGSQTFDRTTDALEALGAGGGGGPTVQQIVDGVWDEPIASHIAVGSTGRELDQTATVTLVTSSHIATDADIAAVKTVVDAIDLSTGAIYSIVSLIPDSGAMLDLALIKAVTDLIPDAGAMNDLAAILVDTGTTLPSEHSDIIDVINNLESSYLDPILVDTGTTIPAQITALENLSSADVQTVLETNDLDHLLKVAHPTGVPVQDTIFDYVMNFDSGQTFNRNQDSLESISANALTQDLVTDKLLEYRLNELIYEDATATGTPAIGSIVDQLMNKSGSQTFDPTTDSLEALRDENYEGPTLQQIIDGVWDELVSAHTDVGSFGEKNQLAVPSATLNDYKADVSALALEASLANLATQESVDNVYANTNEDIPTSISALDTKIDTIDANVDLILEDTGTTLPAAIAALNDLSSADVQTVIEANDLDHLAKVAHPSGDPVADTLFDLIMNVDGSQTFDRTSDALEALGTGGGMPTVGQIADAVWDEAIAGHVSAGTFGAKNQNLVPSETIGDYKADVSALALAADLATVDTVVDAIKAVTDLLPDGGALTTIDSNIDAVLVDTNELQTDWTDGGRLDLILDAILVDTGTSIPSTLSTILFQQGLTDDAIFNMQGDVDDLLDDITDLTADVADVKTDTESIIAVVGGVPVGAITFVYNVTNQISANPIADADVWVTTDPLGNNAVASGRTDSFGNVTFYLDAGTYYFWTQKSGFNFENPDTEVVS